MEKEELLIWERNPQIFLEAIRWVSKERLTLAVALRRLLDPHRERWQTVAQVVDRQGVLSCCLGCLTWKCMGLILWYLNLINQCRFVRLVRLRFLGQNHHLHLLFRHFRNCRHFQNCRHFRHFHHFRRCVRCRIRRSWKLLLANMSEWSLITLWFFCIFLFPKVTLIKFVFQELDKPRLQMLLEGSEPRHKGSGYFWGNSSGAIRNRHDPMEGATRTRGPL